MPAAHYSTYTRSDSTVIVLDDGADGEVQWAPDGLPNVFRAVFEELSVPLPADDPPAAYQTHLTGVREIEGKLWIIGDDAGEVVDTAAELIDDLSYDAEQKATGVFTYTADNGVTRAIACSIAKIGEMEEWINRYTNYSASRAVRAKLPVMFRCHSPYWYDATPDTFIGAFNDYGDVEIDCPNDGVADSYPTLTYDGAVTNPKVTDEYGHTFEVEIDMDAGDELEIVMDPERFAVTYTPSGGSPEDASNLQTLASREIRVKPGASAKLTFTADAGTADIGISLNARYRGHGL